MTGDLLHKIKVVTAEEADSDDVMRLLMDTAAWLHAKGLRQWGYLLDDSYLPEILKAIARKEVVLFIMAGSELAGTVTVHQQPSDWDRHLWGDATDDAVYVHRLAIHRKYAGSSLGTYMLDWTAEHARPVKQYVRLDCVADNARLNAFYVENGFELVGINESQCKYEKNIRRADNEQQ